MNRFSTFLAAIACCATAAHAQSRTSAQLQHGPSAMPVGRAHAGHTPVAAHDLARGAVLAADDIAWTDSVAGRFGARDSVRAGWVTHRNIRAGEVLEAPAVSPPDLVTSGDVVNVIYTAPGIALTLRGTVVGSGTKGDEVYVRLDNRRRLRGVVTAANTVRVM